MRNMALGEHMFRKGEVVEEREPTVETSRLFSAYKSESRQVR